MNDLITVMNRIYPLVSFSFLFISFHFIFIFHLISTISRLIPISCLHCLHLVSLSHYFISISLSISISSNSKVLSIALVLLSLISYPLSIVSYLLSYIHCLGSLISIHCLLSLISIHCLGSHSFHTIHTFLLSFKSGGLSIAVYK